MTIAPVVYPVAELAIRNALRARALSAPEAPPRERWHWEREDFPPPTDGLFIEEQMLRAAGGVALSGPGEDAFERHSGILQLTVCAPDLRGSADVERFAGLLRRHFVDAMRRPVEAPELVAQVRAPGATVTRTLIVTLTDPPAPGTIQREGGRARLPVSIAWTADESQ